MLWDTLLYLLNFLRALFFLNIWPPYLLKYYKFNCRKTENLKIRHCLIDQATPRSESGRCLVDQAAAWLIRTRFVRNKKDYTCCIANLCCIPILICLLLPLLAGWGEGIMCSIIMTDVTDPFSTLCHWHLVCIRHLHCTALLYYAINFKRNCLFAEAK